MFKAIGRLVVRRPWWTIGVWLLLAVGMAFVPQVKATGEQTDFLPGKYEAVQAAELQTEAFPQAKGVTAMLAATPKSGGDLTEAQQKAVTDLATTLQNKGIKDVTNVMPGQDSGKQVQTIVVAFNSTNPYGDPKVTKAVEHVREAIKEAQTGELAQLNLRLTGMAAIQVDSEESFKKSDAITLMATVVVIFILLLLTFRSLIAALMPIIVVFVVMTVATGAINTVTRIFDLTPDQTTQSIMPIVLFGVGTDYVLFLLFRYRERLRQGEDKKTGMINAVHRVGEVIASAAGAVIVAFSALLLASLGFLKTMGPAMSIAVFTTLVAALTLVPAVTSLLGPKVFWPSKTWKNEPTHTRAKKIGGAMARRPVVFAAVSGLILVVLGVFAFQFKPNFDMGGAPKGSESAKGFEDVKKGLPPGALDATTILIQSKDGHKLTDAEVNTVVSGLNGVKGIGSVVPFDPKTGYGADNTVAKFDVILADNPAGEKAIAHVKEDIRPAAHKAAPAGTQVLVGGNTSTLIDLQSAMNRDYRVVFPIAGLLIAIILALLLRSLVAPLYLIIAVVLSFAATIGAASLYFQTIKGHNGLLFFLPLVVYLFVVALGTDYNVLTIARLREEARRGSPPDQALITAFSQFGLTVASAGLILAGSFATFLLAEAAFLQEMGVAVAVGVGLSAFVMSMFLVPAITKLLGHKAWWPGHGDAVEKTAPPTPPASGASDREPEPVSVS